MPRPASSRILEFVAVTLLVSTVVSTSEEDDAFASASTFTDQWAVHISGGDEVADAIAAKHGFTNLGKVNSLLHFTCQCACVVPSSNETNLDVTLGWYDSSMARLRPLSVTDEDSFFFAAAVDEA